MRIKALFSLAVLGYAGMALAQGAPAQNVVVEEKKTETVTVVVKETPKPPDFVFELHGFVSATMFFQDANFGVGNGQNALFVAYPQGAGTGGGTLYTADKPIFGGDVRQTRLNFSVRGPKVLGDATPKAVVEIDFFGSSEFAAVGSYGDVSIVPRMRTAYVELKWANTTLQFGQQNMLTVGIIPQSLSHIAFPATYAAGTVGWRQPGIWGWHTFGDDLKFEFAWSIQRSGWANNQVVNTVGPCAAGTSVNGATGFINGTCTGTPSNQTMYGGVNAGMASGLPAFELRGKVMFGKNWDFWVSGHWQQMDFNGNGVVEVPANWTTRQTILGTVGLRGDMGMLVLQGSAWYGKNAAPLLGNIVQFPPANYFGDIFGYGAWGQFGLNFTKNFSVWGTYGIDHPLYNNIFAAGAVAGSAVQYMRNQNYVGMVRYQDGGFAIGAEWLYTRTNTMRYKNTLEGNQISVTANYYF